jgi:membrane protease YdiL (CAAX protease family)
MSHVWSQLRLVGYAAAVLVFALVVAAGAMVLTAGKAPMTVLLMSMLLASVLGMYTGIRHPEIVYASTPIDTHFTCSSVTTVLLASLALQLLTSYVQVQVFGLPPDSESLAVKAGELAPNLFIYGILFPVAEELFFRQILWERWSHLRIPNFLKTKTARILGITLVFAAAHIPMWGLTTSLVLLPVSLFFTLVRAYTGGPLTSALGHCLFNSSAVVYAFTV